MSPKYISLCLLLGIVLLATTSLADLSEDESSVSVNSWKHKPPKKHWPPTTTTQNDLPKVDQEIPQNKQAQEDHTIVEDSHKHHHKRPWKKHPPSGN